MKFIHWLIEISRDADPIKPGYQAHGIYVLTCIFMPAAFGALIAYTFKLIEKILGVKLGGNSD